MKIFIILVLISVSTKIFAVDSSVSTFALELECVKLKEGVYYNFNNKSKTDTIFNIQLSPIDSNFSGSLVVDTLFPTQKLFLFSKNKMNLFKLKYFINDISNESVFINKPDGNTENIFQIPKELINFLFLLAGAFLTHLFTKNRERSKLNNEFLKSYIEEIEPSLREFNNYLDPSLTYNMVSKKYSELQDNCIVPPILERYILSEIEKFKGATNLTDKTKIIDDIRDRIYSFITAPYKKIFEKLRQLTMYKNNSRNG